MAYIVTFAKYPSHIATKVGKKYLEALQKFPPGNAPGEVIIPASVMSTTGGIRVFTVTQIKEGELEGAWAYIAGMMALFIEIEGFEYTMELWTEAQDALEIVGLKLP